MYRKICAIVVILMALVLSGCVYSLSSHQELQQIDNLNESWVINTISRIDSSRGVDGGYSDFPPETPTLYSTYHFLESLNLLNEEPKHKQATIDWLLSKEQEVIKEPAIRDIYFLTMSLDILDAGPINKSRLVSEVINLKMSDGSFANKKEDDGSLLDTFRAITILNSLGVDLNEVPTTKEWVIAKWMKTEENTDLISYLSDTYILLSTLELYGINISSSQEYENRQDWVEGQKNFLENQLNSLSEDQIDLFTLDLFTKLLAINDSFTPNIESNIGTYLKEKQLHDGGFNAFLGEYGESQGTRLAIEIDSCIGLELNGSLVDFIYDHELSDGGFRPAYRLLDSSENTYLAVLSLNFLGSEPSDKEKMFGYLENKWEKDKKKSSEVYHLLMTYKLLNRNPPFEKQARMWVEKELEQGRYSTKSIELVNLEELYYLTKLAKILDVELDNKEELISNLQSIQNNDGGFGFENSDTYTTFLVVGILSELGNHPKDQEGCIFWIKQGQISDGGFKFRRGGNSSNNSDMYSTYISVISLNNLNAEPEDIEGLLKWLRDCQDVTGGFRLAPQYSNLETSPDSLEAKLEYTGWGIITLDILS